MTTTFASQPNRALDHAIKQLDHLASNDSVTDLRAIEELRSLLASAVEDDMAYAKIIADGGTVSAQWRAGRSYISVEINGHERSLVYADHEGRLRLNEVSESSLSPMSLRNALRQFTTALTAMNPEWRSQHG